MKERKIVMNNEEKILAMLEKHGEMLERMQTSISALKEDVSCLTTGQTKLEADVSGIKTRLDVDITKKLNLLAEGQQTLLETLAPKSCVEVLEDEMVFLKSVIKALSQEIAELKKAQ